MAVPLDLTTDEGVICFSRLAHRNIDCESVLDNELIFSTVENERIVCLELPSGRSKSLSRRPAKPARQPCLALADVHVVQRVGMRAADATSTTLARTPRIDVGVAE